jgi:glycerol-3-phosphate acyltransferase PlsY
MTRIEIACIIGSYVLGAIPFALIIGLAWRGIDIRKFGSGNVGATNILRVLGPVPGGLVFLLDTGKGLAASRVAMALGAGPWVVLGSGLGSVAGHTASPFLGFRGGKGVATSLGVCIGLAPIPALLAFAIWVALVAIWRYVSLASIVATTAMPFLFVAFHSKLENLAVLIPATLLILVKHRSNIRRLLNGTEPQFGKSAPARDTAQTAPPEETQ